MVKLSICITVYNQKDLVKANIEALCQYSGDDIEIIISDDSSVENIRAIVEEIGDERVKYYRTNKNLGHDLNILNALRNCSTSYALVLRSRDQIVVEQIPKIIEIIERYPDAAYYVFSANNDVGKKKIEFSNKLYRKGIEAAQAHTKIFVHPSGNLYNLKYMNFDLFENYMLENFENIYGFIVHDLIRMKLAEKGEFITSKHITWIYADTHKANDIAVNSSTKKISVYAPEYEYQRYKCEFLFVQNEIAENMQLCLFKSIVKRFYKSIGYLFKYSNSDKSLQKHYAYNEIEYSATKERKRFRKVSREMWKALSRKNQVVLNAVVWIETVKIIMYYPIKYKLYGILKNNKFIIKMVQKIKHL